MTTSANTVISQYKTSPTTADICANAIYYASPYADLDNFYNTVWNVQTAQGFGLDIWGRIVGVSRLLNVPQVGNNFGFQEGQGQPFGQGVFYSNGGNSSNFALSDSAYRVLIYAKALANISITSPMAINDILQILFAGRGNAYVNDLGNMQMRYTFNFQLTPVEIAIVTQSGILPRPAGVKSFAFVQSGNILGFEEAGQSASPFNQGIFLSSGNIYAIK